MGEQQDKTHFFNEARETLDWPLRRKALEEKFLETFRRAFESAAAYQDIFRTAGIGPGEIRGLEDLERIPVLRMKDLVERQKRAFPFGGFETGRHDPVRRIYINPGLIWQPGEWEYEDTTWAEALCAAGFKAGDRIVNTFNYHLWPYAFILDESVKTIGATVIPTGVGNTLMQVKIIQMLRANGFMGTPSFLMTLAQRAEGMGLDVKKDLSLETASVGAEMLPESLRARIEEKMGIWVRQVYGTVFLGCIGYECGYRSGLHIPDNILVEVIDPKTGQQVESGAVGEIVATNFNPGYPMIRMATGDLSMMTEETCPCGRTGPMLKKVLGRIDQATKVRGTFIHTWQTDEVVSRHPEIFKYQVVITRENHRDEMTFVVETKTEVPRPEILRARIERDIKDLLTVKGTVRIVPRGTIPDHHKKIDDRRSWE